MSTDLTYIMRPSEVFKQYLHGQVAYNEDVFQYGMLGMALEIVTVIKTLEVLPTTTPGARAETISTLHTLLQDLHLDEYAYEWYERLNEWRKPTFVPSQPDGQLAHEPADTDAVELLGPPMSPAHASLLASRLRLEQSQPDTDVQPDSGQTTDQPSGESDEAPEEEASATPSE